jgi:hypothetical protein
MERRVYIALAIIVAAALVFQGAGRADASRKRKLNRVAHVKHGTTTVYGPFVVDAGSVRCLTKKAYTRTFNSKMGQLWAISQTGRRCNGRHGIRGCSWKTDYSMGNQFWNLWEHKTTRTAASFESKHRCYRRTSFEFKACARWCFLSWQTYLAQTFHRHGYSWSHGK